MAKKSLNLVGAAGEYYVCAELCKLGYLALLTPKNNPLFDVVATNAAGDKSVAIQVKTRSVSNKQGWKLGKDIEIKKNNSNLFIVLVNLKKNQPSDCFIYQYDLFSETVSIHYDRYIKKPKKDGAKRKDPGFRWYDNEDEGYRNNWQPIINALEHSQNEARGGVK